MLERHPLTNARVIAASADDYRSVFEAMSDGGQTLVAGLREEALDGVGVEVLPRDANGRPEGRPFVLRACRGSP